MVALRRGEFTLTNSMNSNWVSASEIAVTNCGGPQT
jgi:hypothetical protein